MKTFIVSICIFLSVGVLAQSDKYNAAMGNALQQFGLAKDGSSLHEVASKFERIGDAEKNQWLPYYYAALVKARMSMMHAGGTPDQVADEATALLVKAEAIEKNSEITCIKSMIATAKMLVDPQARWIQYGAEASKLLEQAKLQDANNPRPYMLQAMNLKNTPEQFGGGCKTAKPLAEKALELFKAAKVDNPLYPNWGKESVEQIVATCQ